MRWFHPPGAGPLRPFQGGIGTELGHGYTDLLLTSHAGLPAIAHLLKAARLYGLTFGADGRPVADFARDGIARVRAPYKGAGVLPDKSCYGCIRKDEKIRG